jgi:hypothetical protein
MCKLFDRETVQSTYLNSVSFINDSQNFLVIFINPNTVGRQRVLRESSMFNICGMVQSIDDFDKKIRTDNYLSSIVSHYEFHLDLNKLDEYVLKIEPTNPTRLNFDYYGSIG